MKQVPAGKFKTSCLALINEVQATGSPIIVTKHGKPVVKLVRVEATSDSIFRYMVGRAKIVGDIIAPVTPIQDWKMPF
jgi:prevent-host-death family protein